MERIVNIAYLAGSHGAFLKYFVDKFSTLTPHIKESPFMSNGTSHNLSVKYSGKVNRYTFEDVNSRAYNNYEFVHKGEPHILIFLDEESIFNFTRLFFVRENDHELTSTSFEQLENSVIVSEKFKQMYGTKIKEIYKHDINSGECPTIIIRDFLKLTFLNLHNNHSLQSSRKTLKNIDNKTVCVSLSEIWNTEKFMQKMKEASDKLELQLDLGAEAIALHKKFLTNRVTHETFNRVFEVIQHIKQGTYYDCKGLDLVEQAYLATWIEKNNDFIQTPYTRDFFNDTLEIIEYIQLYPQHYKAMNPNLPIFNGIPNPFYLYNLKKK